MGPSDVRLTVLRSDPAPAWRARLARVWGVQLVDPEAPWRIEMDRFAAELDDGLQRIAYPEVTAEDRVTFLESAVAWQVRRALIAGRFDLAVRLARAGTERLGRLAPAPPRASSTVPAAWRTSADPPA